MLCCPVMKTAMLVGGLALLGYSGYEASHLYSEYTGLSKPGCCQQKYVPLVTPATSDDDCCTEGSGQGCCDVLSRAKAATAQTSPANTSCCAAAPGVGTPISVNTAPVADGWATVKGQVVFGGDTIPKAEECKVTSDQGHCLAKGALLDKVWDVNPSNKGLAGVVVFILQERDEKLPVHPDLKATPAPFVLDQPYCVFTPRVFAIRAGQSITAKNPDPVAHNVVIKGIKNDRNVQIPPGTEKEIKLDAEGNALSVACGSHPWMKGYGWCIDHPYFAVTDKDGKFEIKNVPAGSRKIVIWHETGYLTGYGKRDNKTLSLAAGGTVDVGTVKAMPK
ncbi:MAG: hypothetical protein U0796_00945 [Gemmatales bacterium]